jgi:hypothetical protein
VPRTANPDAKPLEDASFALFDGPRPLKFEKQKDLHTLAKKYLHNKYHALYPPAVRPGVAEEDDEEEEEEKNEAKDPGAEPPVPNRPATASPKKRKAGRPKKQGSKAKRQAGKAPTGGRANLAAGPPEAAEGKYAADEEDRPAPLARPRVGDFVLAYDDSEDEQRHHVVRILSVERGGGPRLHDIFYDTHIYGSYNVTTKGLRQAKWHPAYVDEKDGKLLYTASPLPRQKAWTWLVKPKDICSQPFTQLRRSKVPRSVVFVCQHQHSVQ